MLGIGSSLNRPSFPGLLIAYLQTSRGRGATPPEVPLQSASPLSDVTLLHGHQLKTAEKIAEHMAVSLEATPNL